MGQNSLASCHDERAQTGWHNFAGVFKQREILPQHPIYTYWDEKTVHVNRFIRYERLNQDLAEICEHLKIPFDGVLSEQSKTSYRADRSHYREVLTSRQAELVRRAFQQEIELHGFEF